MAAGEPTDPFIKFKQATEALDRAFVEFRQAVANEAIDKRDEKVLALDAWEFNFISRMLGRTIDDTKVMIETNNMSAAEGKEKVARYATLAKKLEALDKP